MWQRLAAMLLQGGACMQGCVLSGSSLPGPWVRMGVYLEKAACRLWEWSLHVYEAPEWSRVLRMSSAHQAAMSGGPLKND